MKILSTFLLVTLVLPVGCKKGDVQQFDGFWVEDTNYSESFLPGTQGGEPLAAKEKAYRKVLKMTQPMSYKIQDGKIFYPDTMERADSGIIQLDGRFMEVLMQMRREGNGPEIGHMVWMFEKRGEDLYFYLDPVSTAERKFVRRSEQVAGGNAAR